MAITLAKSLDREARKHFIDGEGQDFVFPYLYEVLDFRTTENESLAVIDAWCDRVEREDLNAIIILNAPHNVHIGQIFRRNGIDMPKDAKTSIVLLDSDGESGVGEPVNTLVAQERTQIIQDELSHILAPEHAVRVRLSNKAFLSNHPTKIACWHFIQLTKPASYAEIRKAFKPWHGTKRLNQIDPATMNFNSALFIRRPLLQNSNCEKVASPIVGDIGYLREGKKVDIESICATKEYKKQVSNDVALNNSISNQSTFAEASKVIEELADEGHFENNRHIEHMKIISKAIWVWNDHRPMIELIANNPKILGEERTKEILQAEASARHSAFRKTFECEIEGEPPLWNQDYAYREVIDEIDLEKASFKALTNYLSGVNYKAILLCKSAHGTSKTNGLIKRLRRELKKNVNRPIRELYICNRISNVLGSAKKLELYCYLKEDGVTVNQFLYDQDTLAICLHSLDKIIDKNGYRVTFDLVTIDESEAVALDAAWQNDCHNYLRDIGIDATLILMLDADLGDLSFSLARQISEGNGNELAALFNTASHIRGKTFHILDSELDGYATIARLLKQGKTVYAHLDIANQETDKRLTAIADYFNNLYGDDIAVAIDSKLAKRKKYRGIITDPDTHLKEMLDNGIRLFIVSPVIETGWRYGGSKDFQGKYFNATVGIYKLARHTAPTILQATQRCVGVEEHYLVVPRKCSYVDLDEYERQAYEAIQQEHEKEQRTLDLRKVKARLTYGDEAQIEAQKKKEKQLSNVMLHLRYLLQDYGAFAELQEPLELTEDEAKIKALIKEESDEQFLYDISALFDDDNERQQLAAFFGLNEIYDLDTCVELYQRREKIVEHAADIEELLYVATSTEQERRSWGRYPYWKSAYKKDSAIPHYAQYGFVLDAMLKSVEEASGVNLLEGLMTGNPREIAVDTTALRTKEVVAAVEAHERFLRPKVSAFTQKATEITYLRRILTQLLDLDVKGKSKSKGLVEAKQNIIRDYMEHGIIRRSKDLRVNSNIKIVNATIRNKIATGLELSLLEEEYLEHTDKILRVSLKDEQSRAIQSKLQQCLLFKRHITEPVFDMEKNKNI